MLFDEVVECLLVLEAAWPLFDVALEGVLQAGEKRELFITGPQLFCCTIRLLEKNTSIQF